MKNKLTKTLGIKSLRVTEEMHENIAITSKEDNRTLQQQVRYLIDLGLKTRLGDKYEIKGKSSRVVKTIS